MGSNETPAWFDEPSEPEEQNNSADLPPWLREETPAQPSTPPLPPPPPPKAEEEDESLPPWLRRPEDEERDMLQGSKLSDDWLSNADALVESVDTEQTYDNWLAMQKERARPKSIEEEMPDLLSDLPPESTPVGTGPLGTSGELPDWFLGLEELDTSDAPDWFVASPEPPPPERSDDQPTWIDDLEKAQAEEPAAEDPVDDFFGTLNRASTLPSGASMDDLFGEFAAPAPRPDEEELPDLNWITGQTDAPSEDSGYGATEMDSFFSNLNKAASPPPAPAPAPKEALPDSRSLLRALPIEPEAPADDEIPEPDWSPSQTRMLGSPTPSLSDFVIGDDDEDEIDEPELEWFTRPQAAPSDDLPDIDIEPEIPEPADEDINPDTINWLSELENIVSAVTREDEMAKAEPEDFFLEPTSDQTNQDVPVMGRGDDFDWPEPSPYEEPEADKTLPSNQFGMTGRLMPMTGNQEAPPPASRLTGMLNRMREDEEAKISDPVVEPSTPEDDLDSMLLTDDLFSEADDTQFGRYNDDDLFTAPPGDTRPEPLPSASEWGETFDLDAMLSEASSNVLPEEELPADEPETELSFEDLVSGFSTPPSSAPPQELTSFGDDLSFDDLLASASAAQASQPEDEPPPAEATSFDEALSFGEDLNFDDLFAPTTQQASAPSSDENELSFDDLLAMQSEQGLSAADEAESSPVPERQPRYTGLLDRISREVHAEEETPQEQVEAESDQDDLDYEALFADSSNEEAPSASLAPEIPSVSDAQTAEPWAELAPDLADDFGFADTLDNPSSEDAEETEAFADMSWLTDDIFVETGHMSAEQATVETPAIDEPQAELENAGEVSWLDEQPDVESLTNLFEQVQPYEQPLYGTQDTGAWGEDEEEQSDDTNEADDFLATLQFPDQPQPQATEETEFGDALGISWDSDEEEEPPVTAEQADEILSWLQLEDEEEAPSQTPAAATDEPQFESNEAVDNISWGFEETADEQPLPAALDEDLLAALNPEATQPPAQPTTPGFDDSFLASLDTLDQMQAGGQSQVGEDLFARWDEPAEEAADETFVPVPEQDSPTPEIDDDFLARLQLDESETVEELSQSDESPAWLNDQSAEAESDLPDDFFATLQTMETPQAAQSQLEPDYEVSWQTEDEDTPEAQAAEMSGFDENFFAALQSDDSEADEQPGFGDDLFAELPSSEPELEAEPYATTQVETSPGADDDFFREMGMNSLSAETDEEPELNWLNEAAGAETQPEQDDPFHSLEPAQPKAEDQPEWLAELNAEQGQDDQWLGQDGGIRDVEIVAPADDDWLAQFNPIAEVEEPAPQNAQSQFGPSDDLDSYLASLTNEEAPLRPSTKALLAQEEVDLDTMFEVPLMDENAPSTPSNTSPFVVGTEPEITEDWLSDVHASVGEVSAGAIVRQRKDRPEGELDNRLKRLRRRGEEAPTTRDEPAADSLAEVLPDVEESLALAPIRTGKSLAMGGLALTPDQQNRVALLKSLVSSEGEDAPPKRLSAIEMTYDTPFMPGLEEDETGAGEKPVVAKPSPAKPRRRARTLPRIRLDRLLITLLLGVAVAGPFILPQLRVGDLPSPAFVVGSAQEEAFASLDGLRPGTLVLFAVEYSPAAAAELDPMTDALLRHVLLQNAYPVVISGNPLALLRTSNLFENINNDTAFLERIGAEQALEANADYYLIQFLPGSTIGLRALGANTARLIMNDLHGQTSGLTVRSLHDFPVIVVVADRAEDVRSYAEQIAPLAGASVIAAVSYSAAPLVEPYVNAAILGAPASLRGLLIGYGDAYTYNTLIGNVQAVERGPRRAAPVLLTTPEATPTPMPSPTPVQSPTPGFTPTPATIGTATVNATQSINVRPEANTNGAPIAQLQPGDEVIALGFNDDESWVQIRLDDGREGWVSAQLVDVESAQSAAPKADTIAKRNHTDSIVGTRYIVSAALKPTGHDDVVSLRYLLVDNSTSKSRAKFVGPSSSSRQEEETDEPEPTVSPTRTPRPSATPRRTAQPTLEAAAEQTPEATGEVTPEVTQDAGGTAFTLPPHSPEYRDERWYAMTLGIIVSATVISFGAVVNIVRSILRRRR